MTMTPEQQRILENHITDVADSSYYVGDWRRNGDCKNPNAAISDLCEASAAAIDRLRAFVYHTTGTPVEK